MHYTQNNPKKLSIKLKKSKEKERSPPHALQRGASSWAASSSSSSASRSGNRPPLLQNFVIEGETWAQRNKI